MNILITGGAGFIGSHAAERLLEKGDRVCVIDNYATGRRDTLKAHPNLNVIEGDILDEKLVNRTFSEFKPDKVIHAAAAYKDPANWPEDARTNVAGTANVVIASKKSGVDRLIYLQTSLCYGLKPIEQPITITHPINPEGSSYAISKTAAEQYIKLSGIDYITFRLANAYGPRNLSGPLPTFYMRLSTQKPCYVVDARRDFIFVDDLVDIIMLALNGKGKRGPYHVSSGKDYPIKTLFEAAVKALGMPAQPVELQARKPDDAATILLDPSKTSQDFSWSVKTPLEVGVKKAIDWYKTHGVTQTYTHLKIEDRDH